MSGAVSTLHFEVVQPRMGAAPYPCLVMLHGLGADEKDLLSLAELLDPRLLVVSIRAPFSYGPGYAWYNLRQVHELDLPTFNHSLSLLERLIADLPQQLPIAPEHTYGLGFSQGAMMTGTLRLLHPTSTRGSILLSGYLPLQQALPFQAAALKDTAFFIAHGSYDNVVAVNHAREAQTYLRSVGALVAYHEYPMGHQIIAAEVKEINNWLQTELGSHQA